MVESPQYTGRGIGEALTKPSGDKVLLAQERMSQRMLEADKFRYQETKEARNKFLEGIDIKPEYLLSAQMTKKQAEKIQLFNDKWSAEYRRYNYNPPIGVKAAFQSDKNILQSWQNEQLQQLGQWKILNDAVQKDKGVSYDINRWNEITSEFLETGRMDITSPPLKSILPNNYFQKNKVQGTAQPKTVRESVGGLSGIRTVIHSGTIDEAKDFIESNILSNPQLLQGAAEDFMRNATPQEKIKYLDINADNVVSPEEERTGPDRNAIIEWVKDKYANLAIERKPYQWKQDRVVRGGAAPTISTVGKLTGEGMFVNERKYGDYVYNNSYEFRGEKVIRNIPTMGAKVIYEEGKTPEELEAEFKEGGAYLSLKSGNVAGRLLLYNPSKDVFVFETVGSSESADTESQTLIEVPADNIGGLEDVPIVINNTKGKIGEIRKSYKNIRSGGGNTPESQTSSGESLRERAMKLKLLQ